MILATQSLWSRVLSPAHCRPNPRRRPRLLSETMKRGFISRLKWEKLLQGQGLFSSHLPLTHHIVTKVRQVSRSQLDPPAQSSLNNRPGKPWLWPGIAKLPSERGVCCLPRAQVQADMQGHLEQLAPAARGMSTADVRASSWQVEQEQPPLSSQDRETAALSCQ